MHEYLNDLYELCETISKEIGDANDKIRAAGGKLSGADVEYIDKLTHTLKSIKSVIAMMDEDGGYSGLDGMRTDGYRGGIRGGSYRGNGGSYARGRRRDARGRYIPERGYSRENDEFVEQLEDMMDEAPNERVRSEIKRLIEKMKD